MNQLITSDFFSSLAPYVAYITRSTGLVMFHLPDDFEFDMELLLKLSADGIIKDANLHWRREGFNHTKAAEVYFYEIPTILLQDITIEMRPLDEAFSAHLVKQWTNTFTPTT